MTTVKVKATRDFQSAQYGSRQRGEQFDYDLDKDSGRLRRDGFVEAAAATAKPAAAKSAGAQGGK